MVKGGNRLNKEKAIDVFYDGTDFTVIEEPVLEKNNTGAGCTFASKHFQPVGAREITA